MPDLFTDYDEGTDIEIQDYDGLTDDLAVCNCGVCDRLLLARRHKHLRADLYTVTDVDVLPPVVHRRRLVVVGGVTRSVPFCKCCSEDDLSPVRVKRAWADGGRVRYAVGG